MSSLHTRERGLTLVELMVAMILSLLLMAGASSMFLGSKKTFKVQEESARIQENIRYIVSRMVKDISPAGFYGCAPSAQNGASQIKSTVRKDEDAGGLYNFSHAVTGTEGGDNDADTLTIRYALPEYSLPVIAPMTPQDDAVVVDSAHPAYAELEAGDIITVSDCSTIAAFMLTSKTNGKLEHAIGTPVDGVYNVATESTHYFGSAHYSSATAIKMNAITYELDTKTQDQDTDTDTDDTTISALYATRLGGARQEILSGVEDFQVSYGIDITSPPDGTSDRYVDWSSVEGEFENRIASLRITLTISSGKPVPKAEDGGPDFTEKIEFVVKLRNRLADL
ncbi:MAG: PilW family protein [Candidatus Polarisedimenticolaceae bacterium]|nr:PilW family protein [Candidatus Polarisedimenticolaceae bacterium]